jgi:pyruvate dehydrogenase E1 component
MAAATSYSSHQSTLIPFYIFYSMFGFQRIGDFAWAAGDMQARGFLLGGTAGRTTLNGEGLQHQDGHSHVLASTIPNCRAYDPTYGYELAVIIHDGLKRMYEIGDKVFYYITVMNEPYVQPAMPDGVEEGIVRGMYRLAAFGDSGDKRRVRLLGSGTILREVLAAAELLQSYDVSSEVWSVTSFNELRRDGMDVDRWNMLHPGEPPQKSFVAECLGKSDAPVVAATDYIKLYADQIRPYVPAPYRVLGTDGFGRSDTRQKLRWFFEVDRHFVAIAALGMLADQQIIARSVVSDAIAKFQVDPEKPNPRLV